MPLSRTAQPRSTGPRTGTISKPSKLLLRAGANAKAVNRYGATPLSEAAASGNAAMIEALLNAGADPKTLTTADGETVLMTAARAGNVDAVKVLLAHGADVNARENYRGQTALMWAAAEHHPAMCESAPGARRRLEGDFAPLGRRRCQSSARLPPCLPCRAEV